MVPHSKVPSLTAQRLASSAFIFNNWATRSAEEHSISRITHSSPAALLQDAAKPRGGTIPIPAWGGCHQQEGCIRYPLGTAVQPSTEHGELQWH